VIIPDINLLIYAHNSSAPQHERARNWWEQTITGSEPIGIAWVVILGFVRLLSNPKVVLNPSDPPELLSAVNEFLSQPTVRVVSPAAGHAETMIKLFRESGATGRLTTDIHLAALAIDLGARLATNDTDFARFPSLRTINPLA